MIFAPNGIQVANFHNLQFIIDIPGFFVALRLAVVEPLTDSDQVLARK